MLLGQVSCSVDPKSGSQDGSTLTGALAQILVVLSLATLSSLGSGFGFLEFQKTTNCGYVQYRSRIYLPLSWCQKEAVWLRSLLKSLGHAQDRASCILVTTSGRIFLLVTLHSTHTREHIDIQHHYVREQVKPATFTMHISPPTINIADCLTNLFHAQNSKNSRLIWHVQ